jgi:hypothetical protein
VADPVARGTAGVGQVIPEPFLQHPVSKLHGVEIPEAPVVDDHGGGHDAAAGDADVVVHGVGSADRLGAGAADIVVAGVGVALPLGVALLEVGHAVGVEGVVATLFVLSKKHNQHQHTLACLSLSLSFSLSLSIYLSLSVYLCLSLSVYLCLSLSIYLSIYLATNKKLGMPLGWNV